MLLPNAQGGPKPPCVPLGKILMKFLLLSFLAVAIPAAAQGKQTFIGTISDDMCGKDGHSRMQMGPTDAECAVACISVHGALYVLVAGNDVYTLSDQRTPEKFAAQKVKVTGTLDKKTRTIHVDSISAAR